MIFSYFQQGGPVMYLILLASIVGLAVFIERWFYLEKVKKNARMINERMKEKLKGLRLDEAIAVCENHPGAASNIIKAGLEVASKSREEIEKAMEDAAKFEIPKLQKNLPVLGTIVSISTLLGLLGTVLGMILSSSVLATKGMSDPAKLIGGIAQALITTAYGLIVAIPAVVGYNYLNAKIDNIINEIEISTIELIKLLKKDVETFKKW
ncbi:MAG: MotA/TolQ/ExbB proton channel family protein [Brevinematia bacterium]